MGQCLKLILAFCFCFLISCFKAWIEASTKGGVLMFAASEVETMALSGGISPGFAGLLGGMTGGIAQAYATMGERDCPVV